MVAVILNRILDPRGELGSVDKFGYSRDGKENSQILLTLCLNENKMPVYFDILAEN